MHGQGDLVGQRSREPPHTVTKSRVGGGGGLVGGPFLWPLGMKALSERTV